MSPSAVLTPPVKFGSNAVTWNRSEPSVLNTCTTGALAGRGADHFADGGEHRDGIVGGAGRPAAVGRRDREGERRTGGGVGLPTNRPLLNSRKPGGKLPAVTLKLKPVLVPPLAGSCCR